MKKSHTIVARGNHTEVVEKENTEVEQPHGGGRKDHTEMVESVTPQTHTKDLDAQRVL